MSRFLLIFKRFKQAHKNTLPQDPRYQTIKQMLYDTNHPLITEPRVPKDMMKVSPVIVDESQPQLLKQDMIERAWFAFKEKEAIEITQGLKRKYIKMRTAMLELEKLDSRLFNKACENPIVQRSENLTLFPARLRAPTETPRIQGFRESK
jgi:hypothetical protein